MFWSWANKKVYVAMSGGVDSSVAAALLKKRGYNVTGVYFKTYKPDGNREYCRRQGMDASKVCEQLGIPFKVFDLQEQYKQKVFDYMIAEYKAGRTPNPDILCNKEIKFGIFLERALADGADMIATGHYARIQRQFLNKNVQLLKARDKNKDQSYFLSQLSQEQLKHVMFPIGKYSKPHVRKLAKKFGLHTADKKDSQGICFIGEDIDVKDFLKRYIPQSIGSVLNMKGNVIGTHAGASFYTIGERHGFTINPEHKSVDMPKLFVVSKDIKRNTITVGTDNELHQSFEGHKEITIIDTSWIHKHPKRDKMYTCRIRHRGELCRCTLGNILTNSAVLHFVDTPYAPAAGQFAAIYNRNVCMGGGVIH